MFKILMCSCNIFCLDQLDINYTYANTFGDCSCDVEHKVFALKCSICKYNLVGFARNYFASIYCFCIDKEKDAVCLHCKRLAVALNCIWLGRIFHRKNYVIKFIFLGKSRKMAVYDIEFIFSCPCFIDILSVALNWGIEKNFDVARFLYHNSDEKRIIWFKFFLRQNLYLWAVLTIF